MVESLGSQEVEPSTKQRVVIVMGSESDLDYSGQIARVFEAFGVNFDLRVGSAHKTPEHLIEMVGNYESSGEQIVYIAVAGRSNALGGFIDAMTSAPVISCPPYSETYGGADIYSSLRMPSGIAAVVAASPEMAALHAIKIMSFWNDKFSDKYQEYMDVLRNKIIDADRRLNKEG